jgi:hypothetical protein
MIMCAFENSPSISSFLVTKIVFIGYCQLKKNDSFFFYLSIAVLVFFITMFCLDIAFYFVNYHQMNLLYCFIISKILVYLLYVGSHKIALKYLFPEKNVHQKYSSKYVVKNASNVTQFV